MNSKIAVIIPALNEEKSIELVIRAIPKDLSPRIVVVDNGSTDNTGIIARKNGVIVIEEPKHGYGRACKAGIKYLEEHPPSIVVFLDADYSDDPSAMLYFIRPIIEKYADLVLGSRLKNNINKDACPSHVFAANRFFSKMINLLYKLDITDLGPFRAIRWENLKQLNMNSKTYGWSSEMIVKAAKKKFKIMEIPVSYRKRIGKSKISGTFKGSIIAALLIFYNILRYYID
jgi:glycosyltransferase involved in cell wall biosynthesis